MITRQFHIIHVNEDTVIRIILKYLALPKCQLYVQQGFFLKFASVSQVLMTFTKNNKLSIIRISENKTVQLSLEYCAYTRGTESDASNNVTLTLLQDISSSLLSRLAPAAPVDGWSKSAACNDRRHLFQWVLQYRPVA